MGMRPVIKIERNDSDERFREKVNSNFMTLAQEDRIGVDTKNASLLLDAADAAALAQANAILATGEYTDGNRTVFWQPEEPSAEGRTVKDIWFDTDANNKPYRWNGAAWVDPKPGDPIIANLFAGRITAASLTTGVVYSGEIFTDQISAGSALIGDALIGDLTAGKITAGSLSADIAVLGTVKAEQILAGVINASISLNAATLQTGTTGPRVEINDNEDNFGIVRIYTGQERGGFPPRLMGTYASGKIRTSLSSASPASGACSGSVGFDKQAYSDEVMEGSPPEFFMNIYSPRGLTSYSSFNRCVAAAGEDPGYNSAWTTIKHLADLDGVYPRNHQVQLFEMSYAGVPNGAVYEDSMYLQAGRIQVGGRLRVGPKGSPAGATIASSYGSAAPVDGDWVLGDKVWNTSPAAGGWLGWVCVTSGSPGTWKGFGAIES